MMKPHLSTPPAAHFPACHPSTRTIHPLVQTKKASSSGEEKHGTEIDLQHSVLWRIAESFWTWQCWTELQNEICYLLTTRGRNRKCPALHGYLVYLTRNKILYQSLMIIKLPLNMALSSLLQMPALVVAILKEKMRAGTLALVLGFKWMPLKILGKLTTECTLM